MKNILIFLLLLCDVAQAQYSASFETYSIDSVSVDSFYLRTVSINTRSNTGRNDTLFQYTLFTDTTEFINYVAGKYAEIASLGPRFEYIREERDTLAARYDRLVAMGGTAESPFRAVLLPFELQKKQDSERSVLIGAWVIYPPSSKAEYIDSRQIEKLNCTCIVLHGDGTTEKRKKKPLKKG